jgi:hypothetical protein
MAAIMVLVELAGVMTLQALLTGHIVWPWEFAAYFSAGPGYLGRFVATLTDRQSWYTFIWLLPLGVWRIGRLARPWGLACLSTGIVAFLLNAYHLAGPGTWGREVFSVAGPLLSLSVALLLSLPAKSNGR